jgi:phosphate:Na+ symporter
VKFEVHDVDAHKDVIRDFKLINGHLASVAYPILEAVGELADSRLKEAQSTTALEQEAAQRRVIESRSPS